MTADETWAGRSTNRRERRAAHRAHADYTGGVYGSMLAASVVIGAGTLGSFPRAELVLLLLLTSLVFWIAHVHAELFGARLARHTPDRRVILRVCREEWPIVKAAVPPAAAIAVSPVLGLDVPGTLCWRCPSPSPVRWAGPSPRRTARAPRDDWWPSPRRSTYCSAW